MNLSIFCLFKVFFLLSYASKTSTFTNKNLISYKRLVEVFPLANQCLKNNMNISNLELIYPLDYNVLKHTKRCVIGSQKNGKSYAFKFELKSKVRVWWNKKNNSVEPIENIGIKSKTTKFLNEFEPMELHLINTIKKSENYFIPYYINMTMMCNLTTANDTLFIYAMDRLNTAKNLLDWYKEHENRITLFDMETKLKKYFKTIYEALIALLDKSLVYTDLKPENILIDIDNDRAYLIDLESVENSRHSLKVQYVLRTLSYFPPDKETISPDRILKYTFGMSIYALVCTSDFTLHLKANNKEINCNKQISIELQEFITSCLFNNIAKFKSLGSKYFKIISI
jgi:serine/threonine protein kinase